MGKGEGIFTCTDLLRGRLTLEVREDSADPWSSCRGLSPAE